MDGSFSEHVDKLIAQLKAAAHSQYLALNSGTGFMP
jgi:hypothetical protein